MEGFGWWWAAGNEFVGSADGAGIVKVAREVMEESGASVELGLLEVGLESQSFRRGGLNRYFTNLVRSLDQIGVPVRTITLGPESAVVARYRVSLSSPLVDRSSVVSRLFAQSVVVKWPRRRSSIRISP